MKTTQGDQASIVGGAIRLVEELEQVLESLHLQKQIRGGTPIDQVPVSHLVADNCISIRKEAYACTQSSMVNVQVEMVSLSSIFVKVIAPKRHHQLLHTLQALTFLSLKVLHLNITTLDITIIYSFNLKVNTDMQHFDVSLVAHAMRGIVLGPCMEISLAYPHIHMSFGLIVMDPTIMFILQRSTFLGQPPTAKICLIKNYGYSIF